MESLHTDVVENILSRLPIDAALQAKRVCKTWRFLLRSKTDKVGLLAAVSYFQDENKNKNKIYYGDHPYDHVHGKMNYTYDALDLYMAYLDNAIFIYGILGSCNGLVCFQRLRPKEPFLVCNPITGEALYVPKPNNYIASSGFGYCHSNNEYKIVRMYYQVGATTYHVQVYTLGGGEWRNKGSIHSSLLHLAGVYANGALHWLPRNINEHPNDYKITAFDLDDEKFQFIPLSPFKDVTYQHRPKLLGGNNLYFVYTFYDKPYCTDIWAYKRKNTNTTNGCDMKENYHDENLWQWVKEFSVEWEEPYSEDLMYFEPLAITRNDEFLLRCNCRTLYCYDLKTSTMNKLFDGCAMGSVKINVILHANSIVSLKDLEDGQDCQ